MSENLKTTNVNLVAVISGSEEASVKNALAINYKVLKAPGAGYKALCVATGKACLYVLSRASTFRWDTCAPHGLLRALGGGIVDYNKFLASKNEESSQINYEKPSVSGTDNFLDKWKNSGGFIAYRDSDQLQKFLEQIAPLFIF